MSIAMLDYRTVVFVEDMHLPHLQPEEYVTSFNRSEGH